MHGRNQQEEYVGAQALATLFAHSELQAVSAVGTNWPVGPNGEHKPDQIRGGCVRNGLFHHTKTLIPLPRKPKLNFCCVASDYRIGTARMNSKIWGSKAKFQSHCIALSLYNTALETIVRALASKATKIEHLQPLFPVKWWQHAPLLQGMWREEGACAVGELCI